MLGAVEGILRQSAEPPIIIIAGDHGSGVLTDHHSLEATDIKERFSILNAYYLPDDGEQDLYPSITPVNTFRVIFNRYFGTDLPLLPDASFFAEGDVFDLYPSPACKDPHRTGPPAAWRLRSDRRWTELRPPAKTDNAPHRQVTCLACKTARSG